MSTTTLVILNVATWFCAVVCWWLTFRTRRKIEQLRQEREGRR